MQADNMLAEDKHAEDQHAESSVHVRGRKRTWQRNWAARAAADVTAGTVAALFSLRAADAARALGVSRSTLQRVCRRLGIERWPVAGRTPRAPGQAAAEAAAAGFLASG